VMQNKRHSYLMRKKLCVCVCVCYIYMNGSSFLRPSARDLQVAWNTSVEKNICFYLCVVMLAYSMEQSPYREANRSFSKSRNSPHFLEPEGLLPYAQVPATCPYPEPARSSPNPYILLPADPTCVWL